eukprot:scaffold82653_cov48-Phaeocystis_antarctica.AAC.4
MPCTCRARAVHMPCIDRTGAAHLLSARRTHCRRRRHHGRSRHRRRCGHRRRRPDRSHRRRHPGGRSHPRAAGRCRWYAGSARLPRRARPKLGSRRRPCPCARRRARGPHRCCRQSTWPWQHPACPCRVPTPPRTGGRRRRRRAAGRARASPLCPPRASTLPTAARARGRARHPRAHPRARARALAHAHARNPRAHARARARARNPRARARTRALARARGFLAGSLGGGQVGEHLLRLAPRHVHAQGTQAVAQLAVVEPAAAVGVEAIEDRPHRRVRMRLLAMAAAPVVLAAVVVVPAPTVAVVVARAAARRPAALVRVRVGLVLRCCGDELIPRERAVAVEVDALEHAHVLIVRAAATAEVLRHRASRAARRHAFRPLARRYLARLVGVELLEEAAQRGAAVVGGERLGELTGGLVSLGMVTVRHLALRRCDVLRHRRDVARRVDAPLARVELRGEACDGGGLLLDLGLGLGHLVLRRRQPLPQVRLRGLVALAPLGEDVHRGVRP